MNFLDIYNLWIKNVDDEGIFNELNSIRGKNQEIKERFYKLIEFGTAGMRGIIGAGLNRLNIYTIRLATQGLANYLAEKFNSPSVVISYDSRKNSKKFAVETAKVLAANNIKVYLCDRLQPTPVLSFCTRFLKCSAGVMITASHNTCEYNGYKCYGNDGAQIIAEDAEKIFSNMSMLDIFHDIKLVDFDKSLKNKIISYVQENVYNEFLKNVISHRIEKEINFENLNVIYTPLNGTGNELVRKMFKKIGLKNVMVVKNQEDPDEKFTTCPYPNPEVPESFSEALKLAELSNNSADILIGTDPDCDRLGAMVLHKGEYKLLCGNEIGALLSNYVISRKITSGTCPKNPVLIKTIVSSKMVDKICKKYGVKVSEVPIGFKHVGAEMRKLEQKGELERFIFGFEESHGYLSGTYARDKDAVEASMLFVEMAAFYKNQGKTLIDVLNELGENLGFYSEKTIGFKFEGISGSEKIANIMKNYRENPPKYIADCKVTKIADFLSKGAKFKANMMIFTLREKESHHEVIIRPSGTEPKIKIYIMCEGSSKEIADDSKNRIVKALTDLISNF